MTKKLSIRLMCLSIMLLLLVFTRPAGANLSDPNTACSASCFDDYLYCMNNGPDKADCYAIWDACYRSCPEYPSR
jgi:hypothetical protein